MAASGHGIVNRTRYSKHIATLFYREAGSDERPAALGGFQYHNAHTHATDNTIAPWKVTRERRRPRWKLRHQRAVVLYLLRQRLMALWIDAVQPVTGNRDRDPLTRYGARMTGRVDTESEATRNH
jgi:hypothetical protein